ncbi:MAG: copper chaperone PCu(A)C [Pseudomonadota bacterium]
MTVGCSREVTIDDAWVRAAPPGAGMTAGYLTVHNATAQTVTLVSASSDSHGDAMLHESFVENGTSKMRHLDDLPVHANSDAVFEPGGKHLMLMAPTHDLAEGDVVKLTLHFADGSTITVDADVRRDQ